MFCKGEHEFVDEDKTIIDNNQYNQAIKIIKELNITEYEIVQIQGTKVQYEHIGGWYYDNQGIEIIFKKSMDEKLVRQTIKDRHEKICPEDWYSVSANPEKIIHTYKDIDNWLCSNIGQLEEDWTYNPVNIESYFIKDVKKALMFKLIWC